MKINDIIKKYIADKYGSVNIFLKKQKFPQQRLETVLQKSGIFYEISIGIRVCGVLRIEAAELFCRNEIVPLKHNDTENTDTNKNKNPNKNISLDDAIKKKYARLSAANRKKVLDYADFVFENPAGA